MIEIPTSSLSAEALRGVIEEFVTRDGTELGEMDVMYERVVRGLDSGRLKLVFDEVEESCTILDERSYQERCVIAEKMAKAEEDCSDDL
ncbi:YheU family protein [Poriferisphaera sp. WC338]|uniref:YheU family protein n=1 Tax=Poriferisphaera sp. WC338 TaxID=3425129 RepID=UPI003D8194A0